MGKKRDNPRLTIEIVVRPEAAERQREALAALACAMLAAPARGPVVG